MGIFDIFKGGGKVNIFGKYNLLSTAGKFDTGYKQDTKGLIKFVKKHLKDGTLKRELDYKVSDENISETINKVKTSGHGIFYIPALIINNDEHDHVSGFKIMDVAFQNNHDEIDGKFKDLVILNISKNHEYWEKKIDYDGKIRSFSYQFINLDKEEYELLKPFEKKIMRKGDKLIDTYIDFYNTIHTGLLNTDKRKKYPIDQYRSFLGFEEI
tara:strand:+ start:291 stop:926 length:636 start_codon:yes stop_codon:yes gene_type:complete